MVQGRRADQPGAEASTAILDRQVDVARGHRTLSRPQRLVVSRLADLEPGERVESLRHGAGERGGDVLDNRDRRHFGGK